MKSLTRPFAKTWNEPTRLPAPRPGAPALRPRPAREGLFRPTLEVLEDRLCLSNNYHYGIVAQAGVSGISAIRQFPSINDRGQVAFIAALDAGGEAVFAGDATSPLHLTNLSGAGSTNRTYLASAQINNAGKVLATERDFSPNFNYLKLWDVTNPGSSQSMAGSGVAGTSIFTYASLANDANPATGDGMVFGAIDSPNAPVTVRMPNPPLGFGTLRSGYTGPGVALQPMMADGDQFVFRGGSASNAPIFLNISAGVNLTIADAADFATLGAAPGIGQDGRVITFYGDLTAAGAADINAQQPDFTPLTPGPGIFASVQTASHGRIIVRVTGVGAAGPADVSTFDADNRVAVNSAAVVPFRDDINGNPHKEYFVSIVFMGRDASGNDGIYVNTVSLVGSRTDPTGFNPGTDRLIAQTGDSVAGVSGSIQALDIFAPVNRRGEVAFWMSTSAGVNAVAVAEPGFTPAQIRTGYGINALSQDGMGQTIAIVDAYHDPNIFNDLDRFDQEFGRLASGPTLYQEYGPASTVLTLLNQDGQTSPLPGPDPKGGWEGEEALDVEWAHAIAPRAHIDLLETVSPATLTLAHAAEKAGQLPGVSVVSMSYGRYEGTDDERPLDRHFVNPGVTYVAATGDEGAPARGYPAFSPNVVAVGGTTLNLNTDNSYNSGATGEIGWSNSGGGTSIWESEPPYQLPVVPASISNGQRAIPDVAFVADAIPGAAVYNSYPVTLPSGRRFTPYWRPSGGTSWSAPCWAALIALVNQGRMSADPPLPPLNSTNPMQALAGLYSLPASDFHDITSGNNGFPALPGYDLVTGLGTPVADQLVPDLIAKVFVSLSPTSVPPGTVGVPYHQAIVATGGTNPVTLIYTVTGGSIPDGLSFTVMGNQLVIDGTPDQSGSVSFNVTATDAFGDNVTQGYTLIINSAAGPGVGPRSTGNLNLASAVNPRNFPAVLGVPGTENFGPVVPAGDASGTRGPNASTSAGLPISDNPSVIAGTPADSRLTGFDAMRADDLGDALGVDSLLNEWGA